MRRVKGETKDRSTPGSRVDDSARQWEEKHRNSREACDRELSDQLSQISSDIEDPVVKLRYLRGALDQKNTYERKVQHVPLASVRRALFRLRGLEALEPIATDEASRASIHVRTLAAHKRAHRLLGGTLAAGLLLMPALLAGLALSVDTPPQVRVEDYVAPPAIQETPQETSPPATVVAEALPERVLGLTPTTIWLADRGPGWEVYSNGLRIETTYTIAGEPRQYRVHDRTQGLQPTLYTQPVGILFHTSESDLWPLEADYGQQLRKSSASLLKYVQRSQAYNYVIDRFGRVYRVVDDESRASHAGHAIWARGDEVYLDLNGAFLGVSFESRWEGGHTLPITQAQLIAGRNLTDYLRQRFAIAPQMCVTHGLTSVSPRKHLIGYHRDWARGFPFAAFGLPDLYAQPPPSVALFGFSYDRQFLSEVGELWPGLVAAEKSLVIDARSRAVPTGVLRKERHAIYDLWIKQVRDATVAGESTLSNDKQQTVNNRG